ncbi:MAG: hypothetical protein HDS72_04415 [Bacteroidales bacterium]|nr:hypothetical protein [Bacteroidales bacterium]
MKKRKNIYAVYGMMEYQTFVKVGRNSIKVSFTGGSISNGCAQPARYMTSNLIMQNAIEASEDFKRGRIKRERSIVLKEELVVERNRPKVLAPEKPAGDEDSSLRSEHCTDAPGASGEPEVAGEVTPEHEEPEEPVVPEWLEEAIQEAEEPEEPEVAEASEGGLEVVEASCKDVAKQYLQEHFGENPTPLRTRDDVQKCAAKYGIIFNFV